MDKEQIIAGEMMWDAVGTDTRGNWAIWEAAHDPKILAGLEVIDDFEGRVSAEAIEITKKGLRAYVLDQYGEVPPLRCEDVLLAAQSLIKEEKISNGEA